MTTKHPNLLIKLTFEGISILSLSEALLHFKILNDFVDIL